MPAMPWKEVRKALSALRKKKHEEAHASEALEVYFGSFPIGEAVPTSDPDFGEGSWTMDTAVEEGSASKLIDFFVEDEGREYYFKRLDRWYAMPLEPLLVPPFSGNVNGLVLSFMPKR